MTIRRYCSLDSFWISLLLVITTAVVVLTPVPAGRPEPPAAPQSILAAHQQASGLSFEPNLGQTDPRVRYIAHGAGPLTFLMPDEMVARVGRAGSDEHYVVEMKVVGADPQAEAEGLDPLPGRYNHFLGDDPAKWLRGVRRFGRVKFNAVYTGIDLVYRGAEEAPASESAALEYDFVVNPGADPGRIRLRFDGADEVRINNEGDLTLRTPAGELKQRRPVVYQEMAEARMPVAGRFDLGPDGQVGFALGPYDARRPLVIDPKVQYSTYLGGSGNDQAFGIAAGPDGSIYVTGYTESANFPDVSAKGGVDRDVIVTRISREDLEDLPGSRALLYATIIGGTAGDQAQDIAVDREGNAYVTGWTASANFPKTDGSTAGGGVDSFTLALNASGDLVFGARTGGSGDDRGWTIDSFRTESSAVEDVVRIITGGETRSRNLNTTPDAFQRAYGGGDSDGFLEVLRLDPTAGSPFTLEDRAVSYLGGNQLDIVDSIELGKFSINVGVREEEYDLFAVSSTSSANMFVNNFAPRINFAGGTDAHFTALRLDPTFGNTFGQADPQRFGTFLPSGAGAETEVRVKGFRDEFHGALGGPIPKDRVFFFYNSRSNDIPTAENALLPDNPGGTQSFVGTVLESNLETKELRFIGTTYAGGSQFDQVAGMALDPNGAPAVIGLTFSQLPTTPNAVFRNRRGNFGGFVSLFSKDLTRISYSTYMWGNSNSNVTDIDFDAFGQIFITGINGTGALTTPGAFQPNFGGCAVGHHRGADHTAVPVRHRDRKRRKLPARRLASADLDCRRRQHRTRASCLPEC